MIFSPKRPYYSAQRALYRLQRRKRSGSIYRAVLLAVVSLTTALLAVTRFQVALFAVQESYINTLPYTFSPIQGFLVSLTNCSPNPSLRIVVHLATQVYNFRDRKQTVE